MGLFSKKRIYFVNVGPLVAFQCPCNLRTAEFDLDYRKVQPDELIPGYTEDQITKCGHCGTIFLRFGQKNKGSVVGKGCTYAEE